MDTPVFDIPQLTDEIAKCLCPHDLTRCVLVSKGWNASFTPRLWRNIVIKDNIDSVKQDGIIRNQGHIRSIETHLGFIPATKHGFSPPNLQMIKFNHDHNNDCLVSNMLGLATSSSCLQSISAYVAHICTKSVKEWITMLERHPRLQKLELEIFEVESLMVLQDLIQACHRLCRIDINLYGNLDDGDFNKQIVLAEGAMNRMRNIQLRELSFYAHDDEVKRMFTFILLEKSPLIESIQLFGPSSEDLQRLASTLQNKGRSKLKQLNVKYDGSVGKNDLLELFHIIGHNGDTRHGADSNSEEHKGLQSLIFTDTDRYDLDQEILKGITQNFAKSLTNLHMDRIFMKLAFTCILLRRLSNLKSLKALLEVSLEDSTQDIDVWNQLQWSCLRLQKLDLDVYKRVSGDVIYRRLMEYVFAQIGRLVELEEWKMSMWNVFIVVDYSYLDHLTRLSRLWRVDLRESGFVHVDVVKWMVEYWPRLGHLIIRGKDAKCLCPHDLTRCVLVSKGWNASFTPRLWRNIVSKSITKSVKQDGMIRNQGHIRSIETSLGFIPATKHGFSPPNLQMMKFECGINNDRLIPNMLELATSSIYLQSISAYVERMCTKPVKEWITMLECHPRLQKLEVEIFRVDSLMTLQSLIQACQKLDSLRITLNGNLYDRHYINQLVLAEDAMNKMSDTRLRELSFDACDDEVKRMFTFTLMEKSPLIESIQLFGPSSEDLKRFESFLRNKNRSKIKQLDIKYNGSTERNGWLEFFHIVGYNGNTRHDIDGDGDDVGHDGLQSLIVTRADRYCLDQEILKGITQNFAKSLTNLHMDHIFLKLSSFCNLLRYLSNLKSLKVQLENSIQDIDIWNQLQWSCLGLQKLDLEVYGGPSYNVIYSRLMDYVFAQIGRLTELEEWKMSMWNVFIVVDYGYLDHLTELRRLWRVDLRESGLVHIDVVKWMAEYWPRLGHLIVWGKYSTMDSNYCVNNPTFMKLQASWPGITMELLG
ncbi:hypothetical protein BGZ49_007847 [Haplosporangium sp. Z 27]|nr:hypothetical protein BGZ49_007847 [Haplosporangium sp. Z 27]